LTGAKHLQTEHNYSQEQPGMKTTNICKSKPGQETAVCYRRQTNCDYTNLIVVIVVIITIIINIIIIITLLLLQVYYLAHVYTIITSGNR